MRPGTVAAVKDGGRKVGGEGRGGEKDGKGSRGDETAAQCLGRLRAKGENGSDSAGYIMT